MDIFTYGTLRSPALMAAVAGPGQMTPVPAQLPGYAVHPVKGDIVPLIRARADAAASGVIWSDLSAAQIARLDLYESPFGYVLIDVQVDVAGAARDVKCYMPTSDRAYAEGHWSLAAWEDAHLAAAVHAATELFAHEPLPTPAALQRMWPMIEARAWAKTRAVPGPATIRHAAVAGDVDVVAQRPPYGSFFRFQNMDLTHRTFDGGRSAVLNREIFVGIDAALVLPYDPVRDKVLLVEQMRVGAMARQDPNPWMLEPIAGIVDAREVPENCALREAQEEAGLSDMTLESAGSYYPSPGSTSDYFYAFVGLCDLPMTESYLGGLIAEGEDLRCHPLGFAAAMDLMNSGEIAAGPLHHLLYWLAFHRDRLRQIA